MIELKAVTTAATAVPVPLNDYSLLLADGTLCCLPRDEGETVINVLLAFCPLAAGYVSYDGMPLDEHSVAFFRRLVAYIPSPDDFPAAVARAEQQRTMVNDALQSDTAILLAVDPFSHLADDECQQVAAALRQRAARGGIVVVATDRRDLVEQVAYDEDNKE